MSGAVQEGCRKIPCANPIPLALVSEHLCLDHFLDEAFLRTDETSINCRSGKTVNSVELEWMLADALVVVNSLDPDAGTFQPNGVQRDRMLELLLNLANLHEQVAHHSVNRGRLACPPPNCLH